MWLAALGAGHLSPAGGAASCHAGRRGSSGSGGNENHFNGSTGGGAGASWASGGRDVWCLNEVHIAAFAGIAALGVADAAASTIGLAIGRHRIFRGETIANKGRQAHLTASLTGCTPMLQQTANCAVLMRRNNMPASESTRLTTLVAACLAAASYSCPPHSWHAIPSLVHAGSRKTVEGTAGGAAATHVAWAALLAAAGGGAFSAVLAPGAAGWAALAAATAGACLLEAATTQLDNVFVPLHLFALLCLL